MLKIQLKQKPWSGCEAATCSPPHMTPDIIINDFSAQPRHRQITPTIVSSPNASSRLTFYGFSTWTSTPYVTSGCQPADSLCETSTAERGLKNAREETTTANNVRNNQEYPEKGEKVQLKLQFALT